MKSFRGFLESKDFWDDDKEVDDNRLKEFVKRGLEIRPERADSFWDDFLLLFGQNASLAADLFGIRQEAVSRATNRVKKFQDEIREDNDRSENKRKKRNMLNTGI